MNPTDATERLLQLADRKDADPSTPGVYALEIDLPATADAVERQWHAVFDDQPDYMARLMDCHGCLYVGAAANVQRRINEHLSSDKRKATLPSVFGIDRIHGVWWHDDKDAAFEAEYNRTRELDRQTLPTTYVHSR